MSVMKQLFPLDGSCVESSTAMGGWKVFRKASRSSESSETIFGKHILSESYARLPCELKQIVGTLLEAGRSGSGRRT